MKAIMFLMFLLVLISAEWKNQKEIDGDGIHIKHYKSFFDPVNLITHIAYCAEKTTDEGNTTQFLKYAQIAEDNSVIKADVLSTLYGCRSVHIAGDSVGKNLVIAMEGQRKFHLGVCNATNPSGCYDVYTTSSPDSGATWTPLQPAPRNDLSDDTDRTRPTVIFNYINQRIYVFYLCRRITKYEPQIAYITRPPGSQIFTNEIIMQRKVNERLINVLVAYQSNRFTVHIFIEENNKVIDISSANMVKWDESIVPGDNLYFSSFASNHIILNQTIAGIYTDSKTSGIIVSDNNGASWSTQIPIMGKYHRVSAGTIGKGSKLLLLTTSFMQKNQTMKFVDLGSRAVKDVETPFATIDNYGVFLPQVICYTNKANKFAAKVLSYVWTKPDKPRLMIVLKDDF
jgi:hypothetical protein